MQALHPPLAARSLRSSPLAGALRNALLLGAALLAAPAFAAPPPALLQPAALVQVADRKDAAPAPAAKAAKASPKGSPKAAAKAGAAKPSGKQAAKKPAASQKPGPLADFGDVQASAEVMHVANWVSYTRNNKRKAFVVIDKQDAQLYVFAPNGKLKSRTPVLLGKAVGDSTAPGVGNKPLSQLKEEEKTTPAGKFLAEPGRNTRGEDIIWIDYNSAVSMHRLRKVAEEERRAERMATPESSDNRISNGCVNVPPKFYNTVLKPTVTKQGAYVYVLPETRSAQQLFGSFDVPAQDKREDVAQAPAAQKQPAKAGK